MDTIVNAAGCDSIITLNLSLQFTGITEFIKQVVSISPNPTTQFVHVVVKESSLGNAYGIVDQQGRTILMGTLTQKDTEIDLSELAEGMYVFVLDGDTRQSFRIVKQ